MSGPYQNNQDEQQSSSPEPSQRSLLKYCMKNDYCILEKLIFENLALMCDA